MPAVQVIAVEGNVGSGKSELLHELRRRGYFTVPEPVERWGGTLKRFYENPERYSYLFQTRILACAVGARLDGVAQAKADGHSVIFVERSFLGAHVFVEASRLNGHFTSEELTTYKQLERQFVQFMPAESQVAMRVLVTTPVDVCCRRIMDRDRVGESSGPLMEDYRAKRKYIQQIADLQHRYFVGEGMVVVRGEQAPASIADSVLELLRLPRVHVKVRSDSTGSSSSSSEGLLSPGSDLGPCPLPVSRSSSSSSSSGSSSINDRSASF
jgi:deoxyadenosine/deoxycytidine kinase